MRHTYICKGRLKNSILAIVAITVLLAAFIPVEQQSVTAGEGSPPDFNLSELPPKDNPKLDAALNRMVSEQSSSGDGSLVEQQTSHIGETVRVIVQAVTGQAFGVIAAAVELGTVGVSYDDLVQVDVPVSNLEALAELPGTKFIRLPMKPLPSVISEGVPIINADVWQADGFDGDGVKIGILDGGFNGYASLLGTELPASPTVNWGTGGEGISPHGTACAEIVYDIAPAAEYCFANFSDSLEFALAVMWLIDQGVDVISCSVGWPTGGPGDGTGLFCYLITMAEASGIIWAQSVGNQAQMHWQGGFTNINPVDDFHEFSGADFTNAIYAYQGWPIVASLRWDDPWDASGNDYDLLLFDENYNYVGNAYNTLRIQDGDDEPWEALSYTAGYTGYYHLVIMKDGSPAPVNFHLYSYYQDLQYQTASGSFIIPADSPDALSVGAYDYSTPDTLEPFSSQGPTDDGRIKPDLVAPDGVSTASSGTGNFYGTSASAPHAAGAAALVKQCYPSYNPADIRAFLEGCAVDLGEPGKDNLYGSGRLHLGASDYYWLIMAVNGNGTVTPPAGSHSYAEGTIVDIEATPDSGWEFDNWTGDVGTVDNVNFATTNITIDGDYSISANFTRTHGTLTMAVNGNGTVTPSVGSHDYTVGEIVDIEANPDTGWEFVSWTGEVSMVDDVNSSTTNITMDDDYAITANFNQPTYTLTMAVSGNGTVTPPIGNHDYPIGEIVDITAAPDVKWEFVNWIGDIGTIDNVNFATTNITMDGDYSISANFTRTHGTLTMAVNGNGTVTPSVGSHDYTVGEIVDIEANPDTGWEFVNWTKGSGEGVEVLRPDGPGSETSIDYQYHSSGSHWDKVDDINADNDATYIKNKNAPSGIWQRDLFNIADHSEGSGPIESVIIYMRTKHNASDAKACLKTHDNVYKQDGFGIGSVWKTTSYIWTVNPFTGSAWTWQEIDNLEIGVALSGSTASPDWSHCTQVYAEIEYSPAGVIADINAASTTVTLYDDETVTGYFAQPTYTLTMAVSGNGTVTPPIGNHTYLAGEIVDIEATPDTNCEFVNWIGDVGTVDNVNIASTNITMDDNYSISANFTRTHGTLTMAVDGNGDVAPSVGDHTYLVGEIVDIEATPATNWTFVEWTGDVGTVDDVNSATTNITMNGDYSITANFSQMILTMAVDGNGSTIPAVGSHSYPAGTIVDVMATPATNWAFVKWTGDVSTVDDVNSATTNVTMNDDYTITANFSQVTLTMAVSGGGSIVPAVGSYVYPWGTTLTIDAVPAVNWDFVRWTAGSAHTTIVEILRPDGPGSETSIAFQYPSSGYHYDKVDEVTADDFNTHLWNCFGPSDWQRDLFSMQDHSSGNGNIVGVTVCIRTRHNASTGRASLRTHDTTYDSPNIGSGDWSTVSYTWSNNPYTGSAWTWQEIDDLEIGVMLSGSIAGPDWSDCTQVYAAVEYNVASIIANIYAASTYVTLYDDETVIANFGLVVDTMTMQANGSGSVTPGIGTHYYINGSMVDITATPSSGWQFSGWSGDVANANSPSTTVAIDTDKTVIANFSQISSPSPPPSGGGGIAGGGGARGVTAFAEVMNPEGELMANITAVSSDLQVYLNMNVGTVPRGREGGSIYWVSVKALPEDETVPEPPEGSVVVTSYYQMEPAGATFDPPVSCTFKYGLWELGEGIDVNNLVVMWWDEVNGQWIPLGGVVDPDEKTITVELEHFSLFTVMAVSRPAEISVTGVTVLPDEIQEGGEATVNATVCNTGDCSGSYEAVLTVNGAVYATQELTVQAGETVTVTYTLAGLDCGDYNVEIGGVATDFSVLSGIEPSPAIIEVSSLTIEPEEVDPGVEVEISVTVTNPVDLDGSYELVLRINGEVVESREVVLEGGESRELVFTTTLDEVGKNIIEIGGLLGGVVVRGEVPPPEQIPLPLDEPTPTPEEGPVAEPEPGPVVPAQDSPEEPVKAFEIGWWLYAVIVGFIIIGGLAAYFFWWRKRNISGSPPASSP